MQVSYHGRTKLQKGKARGSAPGPVQRPPTTTIQKAKDYLSTVIKVIQNRKVTGTAKVLE